MPIYEYHCDACGQHLEALQGLNDPLLTDCPNCNAAALRKLVSATAFHLKGTGWYATDFRDKPTEKAAKTNNEDKGASKGDSEVPATKGSDDTKAAANSDTTSVSYSDRF
jgi:putative FmdB family regulatory protein